MFFVFKYFTPSLRNNKTYVHWKHTLDLSIILRLGLFIRQRVVLRQKHITALCIMYETPPSPSPQVACSGCGLLTFLNYTFYVHSKATCEHLIVFIHVLLRQFARKGFIRASIMVIILIYSAFFYFPLRSITIDTVLIKYDSKVNKIENVLNIVLFSENVFKACWW